MATLSPYIYSTFSLSRRRNVLEAQYQRELIPRIIERFGGPDNCRVQINDANLPGQQGIPDLTVYIGNQWILLEVKASAKSKLRPNQQYWIDKWSTATYCSFIYPENESEVLDAIQQTFGG